MGDRHTLHIKNMVCNRCVMVVESLLQQMGLTPVSVELGEARVEEDLDDALMGEVRQRLEAMGFEVLDDKRDCLVDQIRTAVIERVHYMDDEPDERLSDFLTERCHKEYSLLSKLFSETTGQSIEKYYMAQKIERVKELLAYDELTIGEIADKMHYSSVAHLSGQFRTQTGMTPSEFRRLDKHGLKPLDEV